METEEHVFATGDRKSRVIIGKTDNLGVYVECFHAKDNKLFKRASSCWSEKGDRSAGLTHNPDAPILLPVLDFMKNVGFENEDMAQVKRIMKDYGVATTKADKANITPSY